MKPLPAILHRTAGSFLSKMLTRQSLGGDHVHPEALTEVKTELESQISEYKKELARYSEYQSNLADYTAEVLKFASTIGSE